MIDDAKIKEAIYTQVARGILEGLDTEIRDQLLQKSIEETIKSWDFRKAIDHVAAEKASQVAQQLMETQEWSEHIEKAIRAGFEDYLQGLRKAMPEVLKRVLHGRDDSTYSREAALLLRCWPKIGEGDDE